MRFRVTVRDSQDMGATAWTNLRVHVTNSAGPFQISSHNHRQYVRGEQTVTWDVAGTTNLPIHVTHVNLLLSTNGGETFSTMLATHTKNDGSESVVFPWMDCPNARIKIEAAGNIFFDINDAEIELTTLPFFTNVQVVEEAVVLRWSYVIERDYDIETSSSLPATSWHPLHLIPEIVGDQMQATVPRDVGPFFRIREFEPSERR